MLLTKPISNTKKFFRKTLQNFKSFFSTGYHRLPKSPTHHHFPTPLIHSHPELEKLNTRQWDSGKEKQKEEYYHQSPVQNKKMKMKMKQIEERDNEGKNMISHNKGRHEDSLPVRSFMVERKLRELEMLDMGNVEYVLDIEEVLHYYSMLTCPAYLEIVDNFFMQMYSECSAPLSKLPLPNQ